MSTVVVSYQLAAQDASVLTAQDGAVLIASVTEEQVGRTGQLYGGIRTRLLGYDPLGRDSLNLLLTGGFYTLEAPDKATYPFGIVRLVGRRTGNGDDGRLRERGEIQIQLFGRPRADLDTLETAMDVIEDALYGWSDDVQGLLTVRGLVSRMTMPSYQSPENREIISVRAAWTYTWWPTYRTHLAVASGAPAPV